VAVASGSATRQPPGRLSRRRCLRTRPRRECSGGGVNICLSECATVTATRDRRRILRSLTSSEGSGSGYLRLGHWPCYAGSMSGSCVPRRRMACFVASSSWRTLSRTSRRRASAVMVSSWFISSRIRSRRESTSAFSASGNATWEIVAGPSILTESISYGKSIRIAPVLKGLLRRFSRSLSTAACGRDRSAVRESRR